MPWEYHREENTGYETNVPEGKHRIRIKSADKEISKNGNDMLALQFEVSGYNATLYHYITFIDDKPEITNRMLTQFFDSFAGIAEGDFDMSHWIGQVGACVVKHEEYKGNTNAKISYFLSKDKQGDLPLWKNPDGVTAVDVEAQLPEVDGDLPF